MRVYTFTFRTPERRDNPLEHFPRVAPVNWRLIPPNTRGQIAHTPEKRNPAVHSRAAGCSIADLAGSALGDLGRSGLALLRRGLFGCADDLDHVHLAARLFDGFDRAL